MKKILIILTLLSICFLSKSQYQVPRGSPLQNTFYTNFKAPQGFVLFDSLIMMRTASDTLMLSLYPALKYFNFGTDSGWYYTHGGYQAWIKFGSGGSGGSETWNTTLINQGSTPLTGTYNIDMGSGNAFGLLSPTYPSVLFNVSDDGVIILGDLAASVNGTYVFINDPSQNITFNASTYTMPVTESAEMNWVMTQKTGDGIFKATPAQLSDTLNPYLTSVVDGFIVTPTVTWISDYNYEVSPATYRIAGVVYMSPTTAITLDPADPTYDRIDLFAVTTSSTVVAVTGTPATPPVPPNLDPNTQLEITFATVAAGSTQPTISSTLIYDEDTGPPDEWTVAVNAGTLNAASANNPYSGTLDIEGTLVVNNNSITASTATAPDISQRNALVFKIRSKANWTVNSKLTIRFFNGSVAIGTPVIFGQNAYGFLSGQTASYQNVTIPLTDFGSITGASKVVFTRTGGGSGIGFYLDQIQLMYLDGIVIPIIPTLEQTINAQGTTPFALSHIIDLNNKSLFLNKLSIGYISSGDISGTDYRLLYATTAAAGARTVVSGTIVSEIGTSIAGSVTINGTSGIYSMPTAPVTYSSGGYDALVRNQTSGNIELTSSSGFILNQYASQQVANAWIDTLKAQKIRALDTVIAQKGVKTNLIEPASSVVVAISAPITTMSAQVQMLTGPVYTSPLVYGPANNSWTLSFDGRNLQSDPALQNGNKITIEAQTAANATDKNGGNVIISTGGNTGTGNDSVIFKTATPGSTGTTLHTPDTKLFLSGNGTLNYAANYGSLYTARTLVDKNYVDSSNAAGGSGTVTSVSFTGGLISVATATSTPAFTVAGTSGGIPYFSSTSTWASSGLLAANAIMIGGGAGAAPATTTTASGILTFLGTPSSANLISAVTDETGSGLLVFATSPSFTTPDLGVATSTTIAASTQFLTSSSSTNRVYRTTNAGSNVTPGIFFGAPASVTAGALGLGFEGTNQLVFTHANGTRHISSGAIQLINLDNTAASEDADLSFLTQAAGAAMSSKLVITNTGNLYGTALHNNATSPTGTTNQYVASGTYTPTLTNVTNISASTAYQCQWMRVGNVVTVSGKVDIDVTLGVASELGLSLPLASNFTAEQNAGGAGSSPAAASLVTAVKADLTNDRASFVFTAVSLTNDSYFFEFTYLIL